MSCRSIFYSGLLVIFTCSSCGHKETSTMKPTGENRIVQKNDGSVSLILDKASRYCDVVNPSNNTADWNVVISNPGRFKVWLSSATVDTSNLKYANTVRISLLDNHLEVNPLCDRIIKNSDEVHYPYFRADSYIGSIFVSEPGEYNIQLISEKVVTNDSDSKNVSSTGDTRLMSLLLMPEAK